MTLTRLVISNIGRRRGRSIFTLLGITVGIASFVTFLSMGGNLKKEIYRETNALGANLVVIPKGSCGYEQLSVLTGDQMPTTISSDEISRIRKIGGLTVLPFLAQKSAVNNRPVSVNGVEPAATRAHKSWELAAGEYFSSEGAAEVVAGAAIAKQAGLRPGGSVTIRGEQLPIRGVLRETGGRDDHTLFVPLAVAQRLYNVPDRVSFAAVRVADTGQTESYIEKIQAAVGLGVVSDKQMLKSVLAIAGTVNLTLQLIAAVAVLAAAFGIINTMMTATYERKREIGILQSLGAKRSTIFAMFLLESGFYGIAGGFLGTAGGVAASALLSPYISQNAMTSFVKGSGTGISLDPGMMGGTLLFSTLVAIVAGLYPAWRASRLSPVEAISYE